MAGFDAPYRTGLTTFPDGRAIGRGPENDPERCLGIAGGNGLEHANPATIKRIVGFDINPGYLDEVRRRFITHPNLELYCVDLSRDELRVAPVAFVHAALFFEHAGPGRALDNALSLVTRVAIR